MDWLSWQYYVYPYLFLIALLGIGTSLVLLSKQEPIYNKDNSKLVIFCFFISLLLLLYIGFRPSHNIGDVYLYIHAYANLEGVQPVDLSKEWLWHNLNVYCREAGLSVQDFFLLVGTVYLGGMFFMCWELTKSHVWITFLFFIAAFSFYGYGLNGIRNGMACSLLLISLACFNNNKKIIYPLGLIFMFLAYSIHRSTLMPIIGILLSLTLVKHPSISIKFWLASIILSLLIGNGVGGFIASTGIYEQKSEYFIDAELTEYSEQFSRTGFRWDFLLYSAMPVLLSWYVTIKRNFVDFTYNLIANTYILTNAMWIIIIRSNFSNRFAYLSWFLYPMVLAYPLLRFKLWEGRTQNINTGLILLVYVTFTLVMFVKGG